MVFLNADWERGYAAGYAAAHRSDVRDITVDRGMPAPTPKKTKRRKASGYNKRYGAAFRRVAPKHKTKSGSWKKGGFARAQREAHRIARKG